MGLPLIALIALAAFVYRLYVRIGALEKEVQWLRDGSPAEPQYHAVPPVADRRPEPAQAIPAAIAPPPIVPPAVATPRIPDSSRESLIGGTPPHPEPLESPAERQNVGGLFEQLVGGRLLIWIGGIALAVAGVFLVRYSVGLITPAVRMILAAMFGAALIGAGEFARWRPGKIVDPRIAQSLVCAEIRP
jgi:uncharacterized membrane protein